MAKPYPFNICFPHGASFTYSFALFEDCENTVPKVLEGLTGRLQARWSEQSGNVQAELTSDNGGVVFEQIATGNTVANCVTIHFSIAQSEALTADAPMVYSLMITDADGERNAYVAGDLLVAGNATQ